MDEEVFKDFPTYNREYERYRLQLDEKEQKWEAELTQLMEQSTWKYQSWAILDFGAQYQYILKLKLYNEIDNENIFQN